MGWAIVYMFVILKIPVALALWIVWYAVREPEPTEEHRGDGGNDRRQPDHPWRPRPRPPRRGPHAEPQPRAPSRVRAHGRLPLRAHGRRLPARTVR
jgi:hypothetical protein